MPAVLSDSIRKFLTDPLLESGCMEPEREWWYREPTSHEVVLDTGIPDPPSGPKRWGLGVDDRSSRTLECSREMFGAVEGRIFFFFFFEDPLRMNGSAVFAPRDLVVVGRDALVSLLSDAQSSSSAGSEVDRRISSTIC